MKNLLAILGTAVLGSTVASPLINQSTKSQQYTSYEAYWNSNHQELEIITDWNGTKRIFFCFEVNLGQVEMTNYKWVSVIDPNNASYTKTSWGDIPYVGTSFNYFQREDITWKVPPREVEDDADIFNWSNIDLLNVAQPPYIFSSQRVGLGYYSKNGDTYLQIFGFQYAHSSVQPGGAMWMNLGQGIKFESE